MKHYILLSIAVPSAADDANYRSWRDLERLLADLAKTTKGIVPLADSVWLLPRDSGMTFASECISVARASNLKAEARFVSQDESEAV